MASFKSTQILRSTKVGEVENPEARYWSRFKSPMVRYEQSSVTHIDYSVRKGQFCTTAGFRIVLCDYASGTTVKQLTRFSNRVYGATYGREGELLACGTDDGVVLALSATSGTQLRSFRGHTGRVRSVAWTSDGLGVVSGSDDRTVRVWDVAGAQQTASYDCFADSVRCVTIARENGLLLVGSYDHRVRMFDARLADGSALVAELDCGSPVEALCAFERPAPFAFAAACGNSVRSFDLRTRRPLAAACAHHKSVTALAFAPSTAVLGDVGEAEGSVDAVRPSSSMRLFSASLDGHVRIYDAATLAPTFKFSYSSPVLSLRVAEDDGLIVGMQNGLIALQRRQRVDAETEGARVSRQPAKSRADKSDKSADDEEEEPHQQRVRQPKELQGSIAERVDQALFRAIVQPTTTSAQLDAIFAELNGTQSRTGTKRARIDQDQEATRALTANEDRLDELVLRVPGRSESLRRSRWDVLLARFEQRKCFELVFGAHFDWLNKHRPELVFCIVRELLRRNVLDNCLKFECRAAPAANDKQTKASRRLTATRVAITGKHVGEHDEQLLRNVLSFIAAHSNEVRYERVLLALCRHVAAVPNLPALLARGGKRTRGIFRHVHNMIANQLDFVKQAHVVSGMIDTLLCDAAARAGTTAQPTLDTP